MQEKKKALLSILIAFILSVIVIILYICKVIPKNVFIIAFATILIFGGYRSSSLFIPKEEQYNNVDVEKETTNLISFLDFKEKYICYQDNNLYKVNFSIQDTDEIKNVIYNKEENYFGSLDYTKTFIGFGLGFFGFEVDPITKEVTSAKGYIPKSVWYPKNLKEIISNKKKIQFNSDSFELKEKAFYLYNIKEEVYFDKNKNFLVMGEYKYKDTDLYYEILNGITVIIRNSMIISIFINFNVIK